MKVTSTCSNSPCGFGGLGRSGVATGVGVKQDTEPLRFKVSLSHLRLLVNELILISLRTTFEMCNTIYNPSE